MTNEFTREERYIVFKTSDLGNSLKGDEIRRLAREYAEHLEQLSKKPLDYVVIEAGWSEYAPTWKVIEVSVTGAQPAPSVPDGVAEARAVRLIENGAVLGPASSEDALLVARYRQRLLACAPSVPDVPAKSLKPVIDWLRNGCDPMKAADELEILIAAAPEAKP